MLDSFNSNPVPVKQLSAGTFDKLILQKDVEKGAHIIYRQSDMPHCGIFYR